MLDIHIPPEAVEAGAWYLWKNGYTPHRDISENVARAAIRAALAAWPGMVTFTHEDDPDDPPHLILPLNTDKTDAEA